ncbi:MAG: hypothetical protein GTN36_05885 [Candidatus Aenigmarchaeota archaeon]|nr:hypothetical protein [Candidatus Aenigmarchaeota archaeon]
MKERYFLSKKTVQFILLVGDWKITNVARIAKKTKTTFSNALIIMKQLQGLDIIKAPKIGRARRIELTEKGLCIYKALSEINSKMKMLD